MHDSAYHPAAWYVAGAALRLYCYLAFRCLCRPLRRACWAVYCRFD